MRYSDPVVFVERDASMGWWWVEIQDVFGRFVSASRVLDVNDTFPREDAANRLAIRISRTVGLFTALQLLGGNA